MAINFRINFLIKSTRQSTIILSAKIFDVVVNLERSTPNRSRHGTQPPCEVINEVEINVNYPIECWLYKSSANTKLIALSSNCPCLCTLPRRARGRTTRTRTNREKFGEPTENDDQRTEACETNGEQGPAERSMRDRRRKRTNMMTTKSQKSAGTSGHNTRPRAT